jgi:hypothetical protein
MYKLLRTSGHPTGGCNRRRLRIYGFTDLPPSLPLFPSTPFTRDRESSYRRYAVLCHSFHQMKPQRRTPRALRGPRPKGHAFAMLRVSESGELFPTPTTVARYSLTVSRSRAVSRLAPVEQNSRLPRRRQARGRAWQAARGAAAATAVCRPRVFEIRGSRLCCACVGCGGRARLFVHVATTTRSFDSEHLRLRLGDERVGLLLLGAVHGADVPVDGRVEHLPHST